MLADMRAQVASRTPELTARAELLDRTGAISLWFDAAKELRQGVGAVRGWVATGVMAGVMGVTLVASEVAKLRYSVQRPFRQDPNLPTLGPIPHDHSYPSAHASMSAAGSEVLAKFAPERADAYRALAAEVGDARVYSAVHFPTDVSAGAKLGRSIAQAFLKRL